MRAPMIAAIACLLSSLPASAGAQAPESYARRQALFEQLADSQLVRLAAPDIGRREGRLLERGPSDVVLTAEPQPVRLPATAIDTVWTRGGSAVTGAIVGAILGAGLGVIAGTAFGEENAGSARNVLGLGGLGAIGGALLGTVIGAPIGRWHRRFP